MMKRKQVTREAVRMEMRDAVAQESRRRAARAGKRMKSCKLFSGIPRMSMQVRVIGVILALGIVATSAVAYLSYQSSMQTAITTAESRGRVMFDVISAARNHFQFVIRPKFDELQDNKEWVPELQSGFYMLRGITDRFRERTNEMDFKQAARNPLHLPNKADKPDLDIIKQFEEDPTKKSVSGTVMRNGQPYYYYSEPFIVSKKRCLKCHGNPEDAPEKQRKLYGTENGYGWKLNDVAAASIVYVPLTPAIEAAEKQSENLVLVIATALAIISIALWLFITFRIIRPILMLRDRAEELSVNTGMDKEIIYNKNDELGDLACALDRTRRGVRLAIKRLTS